MVKRKRDDDGETVAHNTSKSKSIKRPIPLTDDQRIILNCYYVKNNFPGNDEKQMLARKLKKGMNSINKWYEHKRWLKARL